MTAQFSNPAVTLFPDGRMTAKDAARYIGLAEKTLAIMRSKGTGPRFIKRGRVFYRKEDIDSWLGSGVQSTAEAVR